MVKLNKSWLHDLKMIRNRMIAEGIDVPSWADCTRIKSIREKMLGSNKGNGVRIAGAERKYMWNYMYGPNPDMPQLLKGRPNSVI